MEHATIQTSTAGTINHQQFPSDKEAANTNITSASNARSIYPAVPSTQLWSNLFANSSNATSSSIKNLPFIAPEYLSRSAATDQNSASTPSSTEISTVSSATNGGCSIQYQLQLNSTAQFVEEYNNDWAPVSLRPRGLRNPSNYCYINATIQALLGCSPLCNLIRSIPLRAATSATAPALTPAIHAMTTFMSRFSDLPSGLCSPNNNDFQYDCAFEPSEIYKLWNDSRGHSIGQQEDAEEFLSFMLNKLHYEMLEISCNYSETPLSDIFRGELRSRLQREGADTTDVTQPFFTLQLNIENAASVKEALEVLVSREQLDGVSGTKTNTPAVAWQKLTLQKLPPILILHLKCFAYRPRGCTKILKRVQFPLTLKIEKKILAPNNKYSWKQKSYRLIAVVYHDGPQVTKGHYIADVYHRGYESWLRYNDHCVTQVTANEVQSPQTPRVPYLLYYQRSDTILKKSNSASPDPGTCPSSAKLQVNTDTCTSPIIVTS